MLKERRIPAAAIVGLVLGVLFVRASIQGPPGLPLLARYDFENGKTDGWLPKDPGQTWHDFKVTCDGATGEIKAYLDDMSVPILTACDTSLRRGLVGVGSFDDAGCFDDIKLWGKK